MSRSELRYLRSLLTLPVRTRRLVLVGSLLGGIAACGLIPWTLFHQPQRAAFVTPHPEFTPAQPPTLSIDTPANGTGHSSQHAGSTTLPTTPGAAPGAPLQQAPLSADLTDPHKKDIAMQLVSSAENSSLDWRAQYSYIEDIGDGRGYTGGIIGFTSGTGDMLALVEHYTALKPGNGLARYLSALRAVNGTDSHSGLGAPFVRAWQAAAGDPTFQAAQNDERDSMYFNPAVSQAKADGLRALGQFIYYDAMVMHGPGDDPLSFGGIRSAARAHARTPAEGGSETAYLNAFLNARKAAMLADSSHQETDRVDTEQRPFVAAGNFDLAPPLKWSVYGDSYTIQQ